MNIKRILTPSIHISPLLSHVGSPILPIVRSRDDLDRYPRDRKFATGIKKIIPPATHLRMYRVLRVNWIKGMMSIYFPFMIKSTSGSGVYPVMPPSMVRVSPFTYWAPSEARNKIQDTNSSTLAILPMGVLFER